VASARKRRPPDAEAVRKAEALYQSGRLATAGFRPHEAAMLLRRALRLLDGATDPEHLSLRVSVLISLAYNDAEERSFADGVAHLKTAERDLPHITDLETRLDLQNSIRAQHGLMLLRVGRFDESITFLDDVVAFGERAHAQGAPNHETLGLDLLNRALAHIAAGHPAPAARDLKRCIEVVESARAAGSDDAALAVLAAKARNSLGTVAWRVGDIPRALRYFEAASRDFQELDPSILPKIRVAQGDALLAAGLAEEAARHLDAALPEIRHYRDFRNLAEAEMLRAAAAVIDGDRPLAKKLADSARRRFLLRGSPAWAAVASLTKLRAECAGALENGKVPTTLPTRALTLADQLVGLRLVDEASVARLLAIRLELRRGAVDSAARQLALVPRPRLVTPVDHRMLLRLCRAELAVARADRRGAFRQAAAGLAELGLVRDRMGGLELVCGTAVHGRELGELAVRLVLDRPRASARGLFAWLERTRAQVYRYEPLPPMDDPVLAERVQEYRHLSRKVQQARMNGQSVTGLLARHTALQQEVMRLGWREGPWGRPKPIADLDDVAGQLGARALVSYLVSGQEIAAVVVVAGQVELVRLGPAADAVNAARELHADLDAFAPDRLPAALAEAVANSARLRAQRLDDQLLRPLRDRIGDRELVVVPTGELYAVAWSALPSLRGRPVVVAPSATAWLSAARTVDADGSGRTVLVAGPRLGAVGEIAGLRAQHPDALLLERDDAGARSVLTALDGAGLAHVAAHGAHEPENAMFSRLELADGDLYAHEMIRLHRPPEHVVLASCELALSRIRPGDEALGFAGALLAVGVRTVTAAMTRVGDDAAAAAMADYHRRLAGTSPSVALADTIAADPLRRPFVCLGASQEN
jgi:tetratricopeptide (TPR) repeat protein